MRRRNSEHRSHRASQGRSRDNGYGIHLYRDIKRKKIGGVAAGLANHFDVDPLVIRIAFVAALVFTQLMAFWAYIGAWILLSPQPEGPQEIPLEYDEEQRCYRRKNVFNYGKSTTDRLKTAKARLQATANRVAAVERYVTSKKYELDKEFSKL